MMLKTAMPRISIRIISRFNRIATLKLGRKHVGSQKNDIFYLLHDRALPAEHRSQKRQIAQKRKFSGKLHFPVSEDAPDDDDMILLDQNGCRRDTVFRRDNGHGK